MIKAQVWDSRRCWVGEGPAATGIDNNDVTWVDILNGKILHTWLNLEKTTFKIKCKQKILPVPNPTAQN